MRSIFYYRNAREISFYYFCNTKLCAKHEKTHEFYLYCWDHVCKVNEWSLVDCFCHGFRVSLQIMVCNYCITTCKTPTTCSRLLMASEIFVVENIYDNSNPR